MPVASSSQRWRLEFQYKLPGAGKSGSLKQPTGIHTIPGNASRRLNTVTPQVGQKFPSFQRPASDERRQLLNAPVILAADSEKKPEYKNALPVAGWHSRQAQA